jgi:dUTP pyrophosphatase
MNTVEVSVVQLPHGADMDLPHYATEHAAGMDLMAAIDTPITLDPGKRAIIPTGLSIALPVGYEAQVRPRSGLAAKNGVTVANAPGTIDADYRGEVGVILVNLGEEAFTIERNMRIAQMIVAPVTTITWAKTDQLPETVRGSGGFGSTGLDKK